MMERLTEKVFGFVQLKACGNDFCKETCAEHDEEKSCKNCHIQKAFEKLAEYEDFEEIFREKRTDAACEFLKDKEEFGKWLDKYDNQIRAAAIDDFVNFANTCPEIEEDEYFRGMSLEEMAEKLKEM